MARPMSTEMLFWLYHGEVYFDSLLSMLFTHVMGKQRLVSIHVKNGEHKIFEVKLRKFMLG